MSRIRSLDDLLAHLQGRNFWVLYNGSGFDVMLEHDALMVLWEEEMRLLRVVWPLRVGPPGARRWDVDQLLDRLNRELPFPCFSGGDVGVIVTAFAMWDHEDAIGSETVDRWIDWCGGLVAAHGDEICRVTRGS